MAFRPKHQDYYLMAFVYFAVHQNAETQRRAAKRRLRLMASG
jgi:hypothetical protein